jgi:hypothetical protein
MLLLLIIRINANNDNADEVKVQRVLVLVPVMLQGSMVLLFSSSSALTNDVDDKFFS